MDIKPQHKQTRATRRVVFEDYTERSFRVQPRAIPTHRLPASERRIDNFSVAVPTIAVVAPQPYAKPALNRQQNSKVLIRRTTTARVAAPQTTQASSQELPQNKTKSSNSQKLLVGMALIVFATGMLVSIDTFMTNKIAKTQVAALSQKEATATPAHKAESSVTADVIVPNETKPTENSIAMHQTPPEAPKYITINKLQVKARVKEAGVTKKGELAVPYNIYDAGWYNASAKPGTGAGNGAVLIDGHVRGPTQPGIFSDIKILVAGDTIQLTRGDNVIIKYVVVKTQNYDAETLNFGMLLTSVQPGKAGLNLITCGGPYNRASLHYSQRTVVFAVAQS